MSEPGTGNGMDSAFGTLGPAALAAGARCCGDVRPWAELSRDVVLVERERGMILKSVKRTCVLIAMLTVPGVTQAIAGDGTEFRAGAADKDITPPPGIPMWGYGARHDMPCTGTLDPLMAKAIVIAAGTDKVARSSGSTWAADQPKP